MTRLRTPRFFRLLMAAVAGLLCLSIAAAASPQADRSRGIEPRRSGIDLTGMDTTVQPGNDFYGYANGRWQQAIEMPSDHSEIGTLQSIDERAVDNCRSLLESAQYRDSPMGRLYSSYMDRMLVESMRLKPLSKRLEAITAARTHTELVTQMAALQRMGVDGLFDVDFLADSVDPKRMGVTISQTSLGMPDRSYYAGDIQSNGPVRAAYRRYIVALLHGLGEDHASARSDAVIALERALAESQWSASDTRDASRTNNVRTLEELQQQASGFDWPSYVRSLGIERRPLAVAQLSAVSGAASAWQATRLDVLKDWLRLRTLTSFGPYLHSGVATPTFEYRSRALTGAATAPPAWRTGVRLVQRLMPEAIGAAYTARYFSPQAKGHATAIAENIREAFKARIEAAAWMTASTRQAALEKLASFQIVVGAPDGAASDDGVLVLRDDLIGNVSRLRQRAYLKSLRSLDQAVDRRAFPYSASYALAWATPSLNELALTAAFMQAPVYDPEADAAANYGGIGVIIGHEISHHFDDQGRKRDARGALREWWSPDEVRKYEALVEPLVSQFDGCQPLPGLHVNGRLTLGENLADLVGLRLALDAYHQSLQGQEAPVIDGLTGDQRFFVSFAQVWREKQREGGLRAQLLDDPHAPGPCRVEDIRNIEEWYRAFHISTTDALYLPESARVKVW